MTVPGAACTLRTIMTTSWNTFIDGCRDRYGVATTTDATSAGVSESTFHRRVMSEAWRRPHPGVHVAPWVRPSKLTELSTLIAIAGHSAVASGTTAMWLHGLTDAPDRLEVVIPHQRRAPRSSLGIIHRSRWVDTEDRGMIRRVPVLTVPAAIITTAADCDQVTLRALVIDALHAGSTDLPALVGRMASVGPVKGRPMLTRMLHELADRNVESVFHDAVLDELERRGYRPSRRPRRIDTPDGRGARPDIPLPDWQIAIEVQGDRFHSSRTQRAADRRKTSQYAGSTWVQVEVDWWEWMSNRDHFLDALDAAILAQFRRGVGSERPLPAHLVHRAITHG